MESLLSSLWTQGGVFKARHLTWHLLPNAPQCASKWVLGKCFLMLNLPHHGPTAIPLARADKEVPNPQCFGGRWLLPAPKSLN